jgi:hypothetical protein
MQLIRFRSTLVKSREAAGLILLASVVAGCWQSSVAVAQTIVPERGASLSSMVSAVPMWNQLSDTQQQSLMPLASGWDSFSDAHRRKWIALAENYHTIGQFERDKLHSRMVKWASLKPRERALARLNFAVTKKLANPDRTANWGAYKALSAEERREFAARALPKPAGAAIPIMPMALGKFAPVNVTRHTADHIRREELTKGTINRDTLLPIPLK